MRNWLPAFFLLIAGIAHASNGDYAVSNIPPLLLPNADAVMRLQNKRFEIINMRQTLQVDHYVITILNENADGLAEFRKVYDRYNNIRSIEGYLYDANGKQLKKVRKKDMEDLSAVSDYSLMEDGRIKRHNFYCRTYPYTIEYTVEVVCNNTFFFPVWVPQESNGLSVEESSMTLICPVDYQPRYKIFHYAGEPTVSEDRNRKFIYWSVKNLIALRQEPYSPLRHELTTVLLLGPTAFQIDDYKGDMVSWQDFGKFIGTLKKGRDQLPENIGQLVHRLTDSLIHTVDKVTRLYRYLQQNTRYVSIQLGIGGWQPYDAAYVAAKRYGDCKALVNYMYSLLKEAGIPSFYTLVRAGRNANYLTEDFPSQQFNHVVLCVPLETDTMWLECTSQTLAAGYLSDFTSGRYGLLVSENGGVLVHIPSYSIGDNRQQRRIKGRVTENGDLQLHAATRYSGSQQDDIHVMINHLSKDRVKDYLHEYLNFATYDIGSFDYREEKGRHPFIEESLDITVTNYAAITGRRLFVTPNVMTRSFQQFNPSAIREYEIVLPDEYSHRDTVEMVLPPGYAPESIPADVDLHSSFGDYRSSLRLANDTLYYFRSFDRLRGHFPATRYQEMVTFYEAIYNADRERVVLLKK